MLEKLPVSVGEALVNQRAGMEQVVYNALYQARAVARLAVHSPAFAFNARLPTRFTADGAGRSPPLTWDEVPVETESVVLIVEDADSPTPHPLVHAIVVDLPGAAGRLEEGALETPGLKIGQNSLLRAAWLPPDPPRGHGEHRYVFQMFALGVGQPLSDNPGRSELTKAILDRAIGVGCLIGTYERAERQPADAGLAADSIRESTEAAGEAGLGWAPEAGGLPVS